MRTLLRLKRLKVLSIKYMGIYKFENFESKNILHGISTMKFGTMKNEDGSVNRKNIKFFLKTLNMPEDVVCMGQVHGSSVEVIDNIKQLLIDGTDGLITDKKNLSLCILTADCLPVLFYDKKRSVIGVAHGGYKGLKAGIINNMLSKLQYEFSCNPDDIIVGVGPGIEKKCYEVGGEMIDIRKIAIEQLLNVGIKEENIENMDHCTRCDSEQLYSYRGGDKTRRFATVISLV